MMIRSTLFAVLLLTAASVQARPWQAEPRRAADAAKAFSLDLPPAAGTQTAEADTSSAVFTLDTPIAQLVADTRAKAVLDRDLPGLSGDSNLSKFQSLSLRQFQPQTGGQMTEALLEKTGADLAAIGSPIPTLAPPMAPLPPASSSSTHQRMDSGR